MDMGIKVYYFMIIELKFYIEFRLCAYLKINNQ